MKKKVTLKWVQMIRDRFEECNDAQSEGFMNAEEFNAIESFITPILKYGEAEEKRVYKDIKGGKNGSKKLE